MSLLVDTSVWSLALRRDMPAGQLEVAALAHALESGDAIYTTGLILQELLEGFAGPKSRDHILERFSALPLVAPGREDHIEAAEIRNSCRRSGIQVGAVDALIVRICMRHSLVLLTCDNDFAQVAKLMPLQLWHAK